MIKNFRAIGNSVSVILDNGTKLFSKSLHKDQIDEIFASASGIIPLTDEQVVNIMEGATLAGMSTEEKEIIEEKIYSKGVDITLEKYTDLFTEKDGCVYRNGIELSIPKFVLKRYITMLDTYGAKSAEFKSIDNFWKWSSLNPNKYAREELLEFLKNGGFMLTPNGCFVAYRGVNTKTENNKKLTDFISLSFTKVKGWKKSPVNYLISETPNGEYKLEKSTEDEPMGKMVGNLKELYDGLADAEFATVYTDAHTGKFQIKLNQEVSMDRANCDESSANDCSRGLHLGNDKFGVESFGKTVIVCLCNPMNVVAVPKYNQNKLRTCAYFPMAVANKIDGKFEQIDYSGFDDVYFELQVEKLSDMIKANKPEEVTNNKIIKGTIKNMTNVSKTIKDRIIKL